MEHDLREIEDFKGNLNYEQLLARQIDRCMFFRTTDPYGAYYHAVCSLGLSLVDMPGKNMRTAYNNFLKEEGLEGLISLISGTNARDLPSYDKIFQKITFILQINHMLFRSQIIESNI